MTLDPAASRAATPGSKAWFYGAIVASAILSASLAYHLNWRTNDQLGSDSPLIQLHNLTRLIGPAPDAERPNPNAEWQSVTLPNDWRVEGYNQTQEWYRANLGLQVPPDRLWEVMLAAVNLNAEVYINGRLLGVNGRLDEPITHNWNQPLRFAIPNGLLLPGDNEVLIRVVSFPPGHGLLGQVFLGPRQDVVRMANELHFVNVEVSRFITGLSFTLFVVALGLWLIRRRDAEYFWFAIMTLLWSIHSMKFHVTDIPISSQFWAWCLSVASIGLSYPLYFFLMRIRNQRNVKVERILMLVGLVSLLSITLLMLINSLWMYPVAEFAYVISFFVSVSGFVSLSVYCARSRDIEAFWIAITISALVVFVLHDVLKIMGFFERASGQLVVYAMPLLLISFGMVILRRFAIAIREREEIVATLERRVAQAADTIVTLERDKALADQRESIMRDMHDGVGGQLVSSLALLKSDPEPSPVLQEVLQDALIDLRLMIDSLDTEVEDLNLLLGALRDRMASVLRASGMELVWHNTPISRQEQMTPHRALQILRILQEALTNAIRHSGASSIRVSVHEQPDTGTIEISAEDNGAGFDSASSIPGRGLANMRRRALDIGATLEIGKPEHSAQGTRVTVRLRQQLS